MTRRNRRGGAPGFLSGLFGSAPAPPAPPAQPAPVASQIDVQNAVPVGDKELPEVLLQESPTENPSGNATVDKAVSDLYHLDKQFQNYHMRGIINAIGVCNATEKVRNNAAGLVNAVPNAFGRGYESKFEMKQCGTQCKERSEKVKAALKELLRIGDGNDALGYIGSGRVVVNSAGYIGNSAVSLGNKLYDTGAYLGNSVSSRLFTQRAPVQATPEGQVSQQTQPTQGGRRTRRRR